MVILQPINGRHTDHDSLPDRATCDALGPCFFLYWESVHAPGFETKKYFEVCMR